MLATETTQIVTRLNLSGLLPVRDPAMVAVWHEDIGHLDYPLALEAARWLAHNRGSEAYGPVKPADLLDAVARVRRERVAAALGGPEVSLPKPPPEVDPDDIARYLAWQQAWVKAAGDGATAQQAEQHADAALGVVRRPQALTTRPTAAIAAQVAASLRAPGTRERDDDEREVGA